MRLRRHDLSLAIATLVVGVGLIVIQPASAASQNHFSAPLKATPKTCNHGCTWMKNGITYTIPDRTVNVVTTTTVPPTTTTTAPYVPPVTTTTVAPTPSVAVNGNPYGVTAADIAAWTRVAICEQGGNWYVRGSMYSGGLGISNYNWSYYSRGMGVPASAADATPIQQIAVAKKINQGYVVPDQYGCAAW